VTVAERATETAATAAETVALAATATRRADGRRPGAMPEATRVGAGAGAVILADTHVVIEPTETFTGEATAAAAVAARARVPPTATTARLEKNDATASAKTAATVAAMRTAVVPDRARPATHHLPETSVIAAPYLSSSWRLASVPAS
jgi:hypothetical protein